MNFSKMLMFSSAMLLGAAVCGHAQSLEEESLQDLLDTEIDAAARYSQTVSEAPASITVITHAQIVEFGYQTLDEVLKNVPGFYTTIDRNYGYIGTRGFSRPGDYNNRILILINGQKINENFYGFASVWTDLVIDLTALERIEIIRGPGSALYGTGAMTAVINLVTKTGSVINGAEVGVQAASYGSKGATLLAGKHFTNGADFMMSGLWQDTDGPDLFFKEYDNPDENFGLANGRDWDRRYGMVSTFEKGDLSLHGLFSSRSKGIPTGAFLTIFNSSFNQTTDQRQTLDLQWTRKLNPTQLLTFNAGWNHYHYNGIYDYAEGLYKDENNGHWLNTELRWQWDVATSNRLLTGVEYIYNPTARYTIDNAGIITTDNNYPYSSFSLYIQDEHQLLDDLSITLGARYDNVLLTNSVSPRLAVVYHPHLKTTLKFLYGEAFRTPNAYESYYDNDDHIPNPDIHEESIHMTEFIWQQRVSKSIETDFSAYRYNMKGLIDTVPLGANYQFTNIGDVHTSGFEVSTIVEDPNGLHGYASYSYEHSEDLDRNGPLTNSPSHLFKLGVVLPVRSWLKPAVQGRYESGRLTVYDTRTDAAWVMDLTVHGFIPAGILRKMPFTFRVQNLLDTAYNTPGSFEHRMASLQQNGRNYTLEIGYRFEMP